MDPGLEEIHDGDTAWRFDREFLTSRWTCLWGRGCLGIGPEAAEHLGLGCCSVGAELSDEAEARLIAALAATLDPDRFEHHAEAHTVEFSVTTPAPTPASSTARAFF